MPRDNQHLAALNAFKMNDMKPFVGTGADIAYEAMRGAHALTIMLAAAFVESPETPNTNPNVIHDALEGIGQLIALAGFATDGDTYFPKAAA